MGEHKNQLVYYNDKLESLCFVLKFEVQTMTAWLGTPKSFDPHPSYVLWKEVSASQADLLWATRNMYVSVCVYIYINIFEYISEPGIRNYRKDQVFGNLEDLASLDDW